MTYKHFSAIENENFAYVKDIINRDYQTNCGKILEKFYHELFWSSMNFNKIGSYWETKNQNEIDLVAINDMHKKCIIADIKLDKNKINLSQLHQKAERLSYKYADYKIQFLGLSVDDIEHYL